MNNEIIEGEEGNKKMEVGNQRIEVHKLVSLYLKLKK